MVDRVERLTNLLALLLETNEPLSLIEIAGEDDPAMDHFNDYCYVVEAIEKLGAIYTFDCVSGSFMNL